MTPFQKWTVLLSSAMVAGTGLVYWWMDTFLHPVDPWAVVNHPLQPVVLKLHILSAPVLVFAVGLIAIDHVWKHLRGCTPVARRSGLAAAAAVAPMVVTGYLIQAVTHPGALAVIVWAHLITGALFAVGLVLHHRIIRQRRLAREAPDGGRGAAALSSDGRPDTREGDGRDDGDPRDGVEFAACGERGAPGEAGTEALLSR